MRLKLKNLRCKRVLRFDEIQRHFRLFRVMWERGEVGFGSGGYSVKLSVALHPRLLAWRRDGGPSWCLILLGVRVHYARSYGGIFA